MVKVRGINYDAGIIYAPAMKCQKEIKLAVLKKDLGFIKKLNCNAIRMYGSDAKKLITYSEEALKEGFEVWISPRLINGSEKDTKSFVSKTSKEAEKLRKKYKKVVFIIGNELMIDSNVIFDRRDLSEKSVLLRSYINMKNNQTTPFAKLKKSYFEISKFVDKAEKKLNNFIESLRKEASKNFKGKITYASLPIEEVNWKNFDIVSVNLYMNQWNAKNYSNEIERYKSFGKPIAITEFGTCSYKGASDFGGSASKVIDYLKNTIKKRTVRDENEQSEYLEKLIKIYSKEKIFASFVFDFKEEWKTHTKNQKTDFDMGSFGIMKVLENKKEVPKKAFHKLKELYSKY